MGCGASCCAQATKKDTSVQVRQHSDVAVNKEGGAISVDSGIGKSAWTGRLSGQMSSQPVPNEPVAEDAEADVDAKEEPPRKARQSQLSPAQVRVPTPARSGAYSPCTSPRCAESASPWEWNVDSTFKDSDTHLAEARSKDSGTTVPPSDENSPVCTWEEEDCFHLAQTQAFARADETVIFFDWDDTLFPTTHLFEKWGLNAKHLMADTGFKLSEEQEKLLQPWRKALFEYLRAACSLSDHCAIVTNGRRPWVERCMDACAPELRDLLKPEFGLTVLYAHEAVEGVSRWTNTLRPVKLTVDDTKSMRYDCEVSSHMMQGKYLAMRRHVKDFYSRYPDQSWKNLLSLGDMPYERDAVHEVAFSDSPADTEKLRVKTLLLPGCPSVTEISLRLRFSKAMLPAYVYFDGDFDLDLQTAVDPLLAIAEGLKMGELGKVPFPRHAWGQKMMPEDHDSLDSALQMVEAVVARKRNNVGASAHGCQKRTDSALGALDGV
mmetsp:Transcript_30675/g.55648  ORF Transcript_30675/g.55648 Transcript_30675/m.55648 type:complete len:492 (+) Transcript_30675:45-1520(+)